MLRTTRNRLQKLKDAIGAVPIDPATKAAAFERFKATGELPDDQRVAAAVVHRARRGYDLVETGSQYYDFVASLRAAAAVGQRRDDPVLHALYDEAVYRPGLQGWLARELLQFMASRGVDVTEPVFAEDATVPEWGSVALRLMGFPESLARPPYEEQAHRLFTRLVELRKHVPQRERWFDEVARRTAEFRVSGELPDDDLQRDTVLAGAELLGLIKHALGDDVRELMAAFDEIARATGNERDAAIVRLQALAAAGHFAPRE